MLRLSLSAVCLPGAAGRIFPELRGRHTVGSLGWRGGAPARRGGRSGRRGRARARDGPHRARQEDKTRALYAAPLHAARSREAARKGEARRRARGADSRLALRQARGALRGGGRDRGGFLFRYGEGRKFLRAGAQMAAGGRARADGVPSARDIFRGARPRRR